MPDPVRVTAAVIVRRAPATDKRSPTAILACRRADDERHHPGKWEFPGGKVEPGESLTESLRRELQEELGITAQIGPVLATSQHQYAGRDAVEITFFEVRDFEGTPANLVFGEIRWVELGDLLELDFLEADREFVERLANSGFSL
jgi:8-oxo-dGTP diphosphatase